MANTDSIKTNTVAWNDINWRKTELSVFKLQKRIYQASKNDNVRKLRRLQKTLLNSYYAKLLAVRRVSQDNQGKKTAGIDGVKSLNPAQRFKLADKLSLSNKCKPVRRVYIPKANGKERPLGIPTMHDRALQALVKMALEPEWEARFEPNSFGLRPGRSCQDAIESIFNAIRYQSKYILDADISKCFDRINHAKLLQKVNTFPKARKQIKVWLKAGILDRGKTTFPTEGSPQGGVISPLLANISLHGMETKIKEYAASWKGNEKNNKNSLSLIRYADDFCIIHHDLKIVENCKEIIEEWLKDIGLELNQEKTNIRHSLTEINGNEPGFDFLGFNIRQYKVGKHQSGKNTHGKKLGFKTIIKPSKNKVHEHYRKLAKIISSYKAAPQIALIGKLNPVIRGWCNYYKAVCSKVTFTKVNNLVTLRLFRWGYRRHPKKGKTWVNKKYFHSIGFDNWVSSCKVKDTFVRLTEHSYTKIIRHTKVRGESSPYDGNLTYWATRMGKYIGLPEPKARLLKKQKGICDHCKLTFKPGDKIERDHIIALKAGGSNEHRNLQALHKHCHDVKTKADLVTIKRYKRRKEWNKVHSKFQKQFDNLNWIWDRDIPTLV